MDVSVYPNLGDYVVLMCVIYYVCYLMSFKN